MMLVVFHHHYRPGGVRRVIELALPAIARRAPQLQRVILAGGEAPEASWLARVRRSIAPLPCEVRCDSALGYFAEQRAAPPEVTRRTAAFLASLANAPVSGQVVAWVHNPGLARNLLVTREWARQAGQPRWRVVFHHHDWWFDNRWARWPELREAGISSPDEVADALFTDAPDLRHAAINGADAAELQRSFAGRAALLPNPVDDAPPATTARVRAARRWLADQAGIRGPMWLLPCRLLRRKNVAEALLVMRALAPDAVLATTGAVSSRDEEPYATALREEARRQGWPLRLSVLAGASGRAPEVRDLMGAASVVALTSLVEGFGLPFLEAAAAARPLVARSLPNVAPDLHRFGFRFRQAYDEILVPPALFDWRAERRRQEHRFRKWRAALPESVRRAVPEPPVLAAGSSAVPVPMSRLTLCAQLEVLGHPPEQTVPLCLAINPFLGRWRDAAASGRLTASRWPPTASRRLGVAAYARRFWQLARAHPGPPLGVKGARRLQARLIRRKLAAWNLYPLLWDPTP